ncbi:MAG: hypothetical protein HKP14_04075, partial [Bacteroidia bacterium]|nr:hypothetical protein [Bacteroidia bacterium]
MNKHTYLLKGFMTLLAITIFGFANSQTYCTTNYTSTGWTKIVNIKLAGSSVTLDNASSACNGDEEFTTLSTVPDLAPGGNYVLEVGKGTCSGGWEFYAIAWIDYNQNSTFDAAEELGRVYYPTFSNTHTVNIPFTVNCNAVSGNTRLRVSVHENSYPGPCSNFTYGQAEDYTVNIGSSSGLSSDFFLPDT